MVNMDGKRLAVLLVAFCLTACPEDGPSTPEDEIDAGQNPPDPEEEEEEDDAGVSQPADCEPTALLGRVWEFSSNNTFFFLVLEADGTYRRETDAPPSNVFCEHGTWTVPSCGVIEFQTCRGAIEQRTWTAGTSDHAFVLDQSTYGVSSLSEELAFLFCDVDECTD